MVDKFFKGGIQRFDGDQQQDQPGGADQRRPGGPPDCQTDQHRKAQHRFLAKGAFPGQPLQPGSRISGCGEGMSATVVILIMPEEVG